MNIPVREGETIEGSRTTRNRPYPVLKCSRSVVLAVAHPNPWASASFYLPSQSLADSRYNLHATSRSSHSRRSPSCRFILCRVALLCLRAVVQRQRVGHIPAMGRDEHIGLPENVLRRFQPTG